MKPCMYRVGIKALIHNTEGKLLLTYEDRKTMRDLPGGGLEIGDDVLEGLTREVQEELGEDIGDIIIDTNPVYARPCIFKDGFGLFLVAYKVYIDTTAITSTYENQKRGFFSKEEVKTMKLYTNPQDIDILFTS